MSATPHHIVLAAGGTGGHLFPAEALAAELLGRGCRLTVLTDSRGAVMGEAVSGLAVQIISARSVAGGLFSKLKGLVGLARGYMQARAALARLRPAAVVGFGGYPSLPTVLAAQHRRIPLVLHEQNAVLGRTNRVFAKGASRIATSFPQIAKLPGQVPTILTGNPVRPAFAALRDTPFPMLDTSGPIHLLITGGSQGARIFSDVVPDAIALLPDTLRARLRLTQQCRPEDLARVRQRYADLGVMAELSSFFNDIPARLAACHLAICRAGASTLAELTTLGRPAILVPYALAMDDHQTANARALVAAGGAWLVGQAEANPALLANHLLAVLTNPSQLVCAAAAAHAQGVPDAARRLADAVLSLTPPLALEPVA